MKEPFLAQILFGTKSEEIHDRAAPARVLNQFGKSSPVIVHRLRAGTSVKGIW